jgi:uncharacterized protein
MAMSGEAHFPGQAPIEAYGNGGFRFAGMSHKGSLLCLPSGVFAWPVSSIGDLTPPDFSRVFAEADRVSFVLLGAGAALVRPHLSVRRAFEDAGIGLDVMDTGAACRTYNVLLAEGRPVAAALIAVD